MDARDGTKRTRCHTRARWSTDATLPKTPLAAVGFLVTAGYTNDRNRRLSAAAVATLAGAVLVVAVQPFESACYLVAAVQGLPVPSYGTRLN